MDAEFILWRGLCCGFNATLIRLTLGPDCSIIDTYTKKELKMKAKELDTQPAGYYAYAAVRDARMRNFAMSSKYNEAQKVQAERMKLGLEMVYSARGFYINYRAKFIAIKIENPQVRDRKNLKLLEQDYENAGISKEITPQGVIYRIKKA
jgi:hypothetical protein